MAGTNLDDLLKLYARRGVADWKNAPYELRQRAAQQLANRIVDDEDQANVTIYTRYNEANRDGLQFIPMPATGAKGIERCFFLPIHEVQADGTRIFSFDLFLLVAKRDCLAFRFEIGETSGNHTYTHVQFCRSLIRKSMQIDSLPKWIPDSYPAFPIAATNPVELFFTMAVTVHGYEGGLTTVLQEIFMAANKTNEFKNYASELKAVLNC